MQQKPSNVHCSGSTCPLGLRKMHTGSAGILAGDHTISHIWSDLQYNLIFCIKFKVNSSTSLGLVFILVSDL